MEALHESARMVHCKTNNTAWNLTQRGSNLAQWETYRERAEGKCRWEIWVPLITVASNPAMWRAAGRKPRVSLSHQLSLPTPNPSVLPAMWLHPKGKTHTKSHENSKCQTRPPKQPSDSKLSPSLQKSLHVVYAWVCVMQKLQVDEWRPSQEIMQLSFIWRSHRLIYLSLSFEHSSNDLGTLLPWLLWAFTLGSAPSHDLNFLRNREKTYLANGNLMIAIGNDFEVVHGNTLHYCPPKKSCTPCWLHHICHPYQ
jgi:hypothetical protein